MPAAFCHRAVVAGRRNSVVLVAAGGRVEEQAGRQVIVTAVSRVLLPDESRAKKLDHVE